MYIIQLNGIKKTPARDDKVIIKTTGAKLKQRD